MAMGQEELGRRIREAREEAGLTQPQLAETLGLKHPQSISNYERGVTEIPTKRLRRIAEATGKPMSFFVTDAPRLADPEMVEERLAAVELLLAELVSEVRLSRKAGGGSGA